MPDISPENLFAEVEEILENLPRPHPTHQASTPAPVVRMDWANVPTQADGHMEMHTVPCNDIRAHRLCEACACRPVEESTTPDLWIHNAFDGREKHLEHGAPMH